MKNFNNYRFFKASALFAFLTLLSFFAFASEDKGVLRDNFLVDLFAFIFPVFKFPLLTLFWDFFTKDVSLYFLALVINCGMYGCITEWITAQIITYREDKIKAEA